MYINNYNRINIKHILDVFALMQAYFNLSLCEQSFIIVCEEDNMANDNIHRLKRIWIALLMIISWALCLISVNFPEDHVLVYSPILMYVLYSVMAVLSIGALLVILLKKPLISDILIVAVLTCYFVLFGIIFVQRLIRSYVLFFPLMTISLFIIAIFSIVTFILLIIGKRREGYLLTIFAYSFFTLCVVIESYPVAYEQVSEVYGNIKLIYFVAIIAASILGIINSVQAYREHK